MQDTQQLGRTPVYKMGERFAARIPGMLTGGININFQKKGNCFVAQRYNNSICYYINCFRCFEDSPVVYEIVLKEEFQTFFHVCKGEKYKKTIFRVDEETHVRFELITE